MLKVRNRTLLLIAAVVWFVAGANILRLGIQATFETDLPLGLILAGIAIVFLMFHIMFTKLIGKHSTRIREYGNNRIHFLKFFDIKSYIIMAIMMSGGISLRAFGIIPTWFVAFFYTGLGIALTLAGIGFFVHFAKAGGIIVCPITKKSRLA